MKYTFEQTGLWKRSLQPASNAHEHELERLRAALLAMRANAARLVSFIPEDCKALTVHDVSHLDALWEMADVIAGDEFTLNPVEAFVFGAAVLIHDAGMTVASYPGGVSDLIKTTEWQDTATAVYRRAGIQHFSEEPVAHPPEGLRAEILFSVLRALHAKHAEDLILTTWISSDKKQEVRLLDDPELRNAFGQSIGRIAHSHHWDIERVATDLRDQTGSAADLPTEWTLNEVKVACLLRCADAAHIDHRRAPSLLYALTRPTGISQLHWNFQNKLKKATRNGERLVYTEASDFSLSDAPSWWLCYDTIKIIDKELSSSYALLQDRGEKPFAARRVLGAESPRLLARQIGCVGWFPVDAEIRVSDPVNLARTLGGKNLYGLGLLPPIRELLQNAADAVRARWAFEERDADWGKIRLIVERTGDEVWIHVDDNGVGMSERVLVGALLDFGKSFWNSWLLREELPGLEARGIRPIGKFGIGFFSIFNLGEHVRVVSKKFDTGVSDTRVLEFLSIGARPIVRPAKQGELPRDYSTRVSVKLADVRVLEINNGVRLQFLGHYRHPRQRTFSDSIKLLVSGLDIECEIVDDERHAYTHMPKWTELDAHDFLEIIIPEYTGGRGYKKSTLVDAHVDMVRPLSDTSGQIYGRAAILMLGDDESSYLSVGGFVTSSRQELPIPYIGIIAGETNEISRTVVSAEIPPEVVSIWASEQARLLDRKRFTRAQLMLACQRIVRAHGDPGDLPFCVAGNRFVSYAECRKVLQKLDCVYLMLDNVYSSNFTMVGLAKLTAIRLLQEMREDVLIIASGEETSLISDELGQKILNESELSVSQDELRPGPSVAMLLQLCLDLWGNEPELKILRSNVNTDRFWSGADVSWALAINRRVT